MQRQQRHVTRLPQRFASVRMHAHASADQQAKEEEQAARHDELLARVASGKLARGHTVNASRVRVKRVVHLGRGRRRGGLRGG